MCTELGVEMGRRTSGTRSSSQALYEKSWKTRSFVLSSRFFTAGGNNSLSHPHTERSATKNEIKRVLQNLRRMRKSLCGGENSGRLRFEAEMLLRTRPVKQGTGGSAC